MVEVTQTMFRRILIYALGAVFLTAGTCVIIPEKHPVVKREIQKNPKKFQKVRHLGEKGKNKTHRVSSVRLWQG